MRAYLIAIFLLAGNIALAQNGTKKIKLTDLWRDYTFRVKSVPGFNAMKDGLHYTKTDQDGKKQSINKYDLKTGEKVAVVLDASRFSIPDSLGNIDEYVFSKDEQKMLLLFKSQNIYRRSILHYVLVADLQKGTLTSVDAGKVLHATFSPDGTKVAFVKNNNLYYRDLQANKTIAVTTDGERNKIINGNCDWVYEEEFEFTRAYDWSGDGRTIAYYRFDERAVPEYTMTVYDSLYPKPYKFKYPKAGDANSIIRIKFYDLAAKTTKLADIGAETDQYIPRIKWTNDASRLCIYRMNRLQNRLEYLLADAKTGKSTVVYTEENPYYVEVNDNLRFMPDGKSFLYSSEEDGYHHLYIYNWISKQRTLLTDGAYDIESVVDIDEKNKLVYYTAAEASPVERKLYSVDWNGQNKKCLTPEDGTHAITPIGGNNYFLDKYSTLNQPPVFYLRDASGRMVRTLEDNAALKAVMKTYKLGDVKLTQVQGAGGVALNAWMITPPGFDAAKKYPVLMYQYSGPNSQQVADKFPIGDYFWHQMLAQKGYIIVCADGTGTGFRGQAFQKKTYQQLGKYESDDQIAVAKYLGTLPYVDKERIGIWGWSYGGFMSSTCLLKGNDVFKMAIAVAPVTNWRYYDNIYTERYMRKPQDNPTGYDENAPELMADRLKGKFLLVHGTGDDNVHFQNTVSLVDNLIRYNKDYDSEFYPNRNHGIGGGNTRLHLYRRMTWFILDNL